MTRTQTTTMFTDPVPYNMFWLFEGSLLQIYIIYNIKIMLYIHTRYPKNDIIYDIFEMIENWLKVKNDRIIIRTYF